MSDQETSTPEAPAEPNLGLLAQEVFGSDYHGNVEPTETPEEIPELEEPQEPVETLEVTPEETPEETIETEEETPISSFSELVENQGWDPEWANSLEIPVKVDGESSSATLSDLVRSYQTQEAADKRLTEAKEKAKSQNQALATKEQNLDALIGIAGSFLGKQQKALQEEYAALDKDSLRDTDPAEWSAKKQELQDRMTAFQGEVNQLASVHQQQAQQKEQETEQQRQERLQKEHQSLLEKLPEWADVEVQEKEQKQLHEYLSGLEMSPDSYAAIDSDHNLFLMVRKARLFDEMESKAEPAKKKLVKVPKVLKPGPSQTPVDTNQTRISELETLINENPNHRYVMKWSTELHQLRRGNK